MTAPFYRLCGRGRPVYDVGEILREKPFVNPATLNGLKRLAKFGVGPQQSWKNK